MFLKRLTITGRQGVIRDIPFYKGVNLIVDERNEIERKHSGNSIGKTTVLRLIDYCLGSKGYSIYKDVEFSDQPNTTIENFLIDNEVLIILELVDDIENITSRVVIERNFLKRGDKILKINGVEISTNDFDIELKQALFNTNVEKPSFRQIISKNIRLEKDRMDKIVRVLGNYGKAEEYEALFLFWLGIDTANSYRKYHLAVERRTESNFRKRLAKEGGLPLIEQKLAFHLDKITEIQAKKNSFNLNEKYSENIEQLNLLKLSLNRKASDLSQLEVRKDLIMESKIDLEQEYSNIDANQIKSLYDRASVLVPNIQVTFEETLKFHNDLISEKLDYITKELPDLDRKVISIRNEIRQLQREEQDLTIRLQKMGVTEDLENLILELNKQFERKGNLEEQKRLWEVSNQKLERIEIDLSLINENITSKDDLIKNRVTQFNKYFARMSELLYGESYILTPIKKESGYDLSVDNIEGNPSTGKKKGQIAAFDFAYIQFADDFGIKCLHFILHDQLENIHDNQLNTLIEVASNLNGQYIVPILRDKVPNNIDISQYERLSLSQNDKLFKIP